ncbi:MAG TPA: tetratricopeptide repeat protein [Pyrinomonadaceae bacterium]|nr:tetratricopeptide repeat protein [Pyrinomonadaceae bacterium]
MERHAQLSCELAKELEEKGEYEEARKALGNYWQHLGERPNVEGLDQGMAAEVLLRVGVLTGAIGSKNRIPESEETAKNLISESLTIFESQSYRKKIAEAQTELALCYWRAGELNEARDFLKAALAHLSTESEVKAKAIVRLAIVERGAANYSKALRILTENAALFQKIKNQTLKGSYHVTLGITLRNLWELKNLPEYIDRALIEYAAASYHFEQAEHRCYLANTENNLGFLYYKLKRYEEAHKHMDHARRVLVSLNDVSTVAQVDETRACVFLEQGRIAEAERTARSAVRALEKSDRNTLLSEVLTTHGRALARLGNYGLALLSFRRAIFLAEQTGNISRAAQAALVAFQEIGSRLAVSEERTLVAGGKLNKEVRALEHDLIKRALDINQGSITHAARSLGISHQTLNYMLETRHKDLLKKRRPPRRRPRK